MLFRAAATTDLDSMEHIIDQAKAALGRAGIDQWQDGYPDRAALDEDVRLGDAYVLEENGVVVGTVAVSFAGEPVYKDLTGGAWLSDGAYAVVHRMALADSHKGRGLSALFLKEIEALCVTRNVPSIKVDTHPQNMIMQALLTRSDYVPCGTVIFQGSGKLAYEKLL